MIGSFIYQLIIVTIIFQANDTSGSSKRKKKKRKGAKEDVLTKKKNIGIYEDFVGDQPTRFKYREVPANDFGLTAEELLFASDKELNKWVSLKKACQYRSIEEEKYDQKVYARKKDNMFLKQKVLKSLYKSDEGQSSKKK